MTWHPRLGSGFTGRAGLGTLLAHELVEHRVAQAAGLGDHVPFDRRDRIGRSAPRPSAKMRASRFCAIGLPLKGRTSQNLRAAAASFLADTGAVEQRDPVFDLRVDIVGERRHAEQPRRLSGHPSAGRCLPCRGSQARTWLRNCRPVRRPERVRQRGQSPEEIPGLRDTADQGHRRQARFRAWRRRE